MIIDRGIMLQKEKHEYIQNVLVRYQVGQQLDKEDFELINKWYTESSFCPTKKVEAITVSNAAFGSKCLTFHYTNGTMGHVSRHIIVGKKKIKKE